MTKLADAIRRTQRVDAAPMGFGAVRNASPPTMLVGALVSELKPRKRNDSTTSREPSQGLDNPATLLPQLERTD